MDLDLPQQKPTEPVVSKRTCLIFLNWKIKPGMTMMKESSSGELQGLLFVVYNQFLPRISSAQPRFATKGKKGGDGWWWSLVLNRVIGIELYSRPSGRMGGMHAAYCTQVISFTSFVMALPEEKHLELNPHDRKRPSKTAQGPAFLMPITDA